MFDKPLDWRDFFSFELRDLIYIPIFFGVCFALVGLVFIVWGLGSLVWSIYDRFNKPTIFRDTLSEDVEEFEEDVEDLIGFKEDVIEFKEDVIGPIVETQTNFK